MKLTTDIKPRKDGSAIAIGASGTRYTLIAEPGMEGLTCVVMDPIDIAFLLDTGNFYPDNEQDIDKGIEAVLQQQAAVVTETGSDEDPLTPPLLIADEELAPIAKKKPRR